MIVNWIGIIDVVLFFIFMTFTGKSLSEYVMLMVVALGVLMIVIFLADYERQYPALLYVRLFISVIAGVVIVVSTMVSWLPNNESRKYELSQEGAKIEMAHINKKSGVPHCKYEETPDGFTIGFRKPPFDLVRASDIFFILAFFEDFDSNSKKVNTSTIKVDKQFVFVHGKRFKRRDFGGFLVARTYETLFKTASELGFKDGEQIVSFGGAWKKQEAYEVADALNHLLRVIPIEDDIVLEGNMDEKPKS